MLQRNLLYTGVTRAKQLIVLAGSRRTLAQAVRTLEPAAATPHSPVDSIPPNSCRLHVNDSYRQHSRHVYTTG